MKYCFTVILIFLLSQHSLLMAQDTEKTRPVKLLIEAGIEFGGDEILTVFFTNGEDQKMRAGQGGFLAVGGEFIVSQAFMVRSTIGVKYNTTAADNANIRLLRFPFNLMGFWKINENFRAGAGATTHLGTNLKGDGFLPDVDFTSSVGPRFEFGYRWIAVTYTSVQYKDESDEKFSASSFGVALSFTIPNR